MEKGTGTRLIGVTPINGNISPTIRALRCVYLLVSGAMASARGGERGGAGMESFSGGTTIGIAALPRGGPRVRTK